MSKIAFINNKPYPFHEGETMLAFIRRNTGRDSVPTLCDAPNLAPFGSCRVCCVDVALEENGKTRAMASCHTPVTENIHLYPDTDNVKMLRKNILELVLSDLPEEQRFAYSSRPTELQKLVRQVGIDEVRYENSTRKIFAQDDSHPYMRSELNMCINCFRCVRACDEVQ